MQIFRTVVIIWLLMVISYRLDLIVQHMNNLSTETGVSCEVTPPAQVSTEIEEEVYEF